MTDDIRVRVRRPDPPQAGTSFEGCPVLRVPADPRVVIGIDPSLTCTGIGILSQGKLRSTSMSAPRKVMGVERLVWFHAEFKALLSRYRPDLVVIEGYAYGAKQNREALGELGGVLRIAVHESKAPMVITAPTRLKLFATGTGNSGKPAVSKEIFKRFGVDLMDDNQVDAAVLAIMGLASLRPEIVTAEFQRRALATD